MISLFNQILLIITINRKAINTTAYYYPNTNNDNTYLSKIYVFGTR